MSLKNFSVVGYESYKDTYTIELFIKSTERKTPIFVERNVNVEFLCSKNKRSCFLDRVANMTRTCGLEYLT